MIPTIYILVCLAFYATFMKFQLVTRSYELLREVQFTGEILRNRKLSDHDKKVRLRRAATGTLIQTMSLATRLGLVLAAAGAPAFLADRTIGLDVSDLAAFSLNPVVLVGTVAAIAGLDKLRRTVAQ